MITPTSRILHALADLDPVYREAVAERFATPAYMEPMVSHDGISDPTAAIALDPARWALSEAVANLDESIAKMTAALDVHAARLRAALADLTRESRED